MIFHAGGFSNAPKFDKLPLMATGNCKIQFLCHIIVVGMRETRILWAHVRPRDGLWTEQSIKSDTGVFLYSVRFFVNALRFAPGSW